MASKISDDLLLVALLFAPIRDVSFLRIRHEYADVLRAHGDVISRHFNAIMVGTVT